MRHSLLPLIIVLLLATILIQGCARPLLQTFPASSQETDMVYGAFARFQQTTEMSCGCCLDAEADAELVVSGWFSEHTGKLSGYLQAMEPGYIKFVTLNPLGQPLLIFVTDGRMFKSLNVYAEKAYTGSVDSETYRKFAPEGFVPEFSYYWLTGRLEPGDLQVRDIMRSKDKGLFWLQAPYQGSPAIESMILFDPTELVVLRHVLRDDRGAHLLDILYGDYLEPEGAGNKDTKFMECRIPARITVSSGKNTEKIAIELHSFLPDAHISTTDFRISIPDNFEVLPVR